MHEQMLIQPEIMKIRHELMHDKFRIERLRKPFTVGSVDLLSSCARAFALEFKKSECVPRAKRPHASMWLFSKSVHIVRRLPRCITNPIPSGFRPWCPQMPPRLEVQVAIASMPAAIA